MSLRWARPGTTERALELARSGTCASFTAVMRALAREGYFDARAQLDGAAIRKQLTDIIKQARARSTQVHPAE